MLCQVIEAMRHFAFPGRSFLFIFPQVYDVDVDVNVDLIVLFVVVVVAAAVVAVGGGKNQERP